MKSSTCNSCNTAMRHQQNTVTGKQPGSPGWLVALAIALAATLGLPGAPAAQQVDTDVDPAVVDTLFEEWDREGSPGCALGVYHDDEMLYQQGYGEANLDYGVPIRPEETRFYIASVSKQFTAAAIAILADQGELDLDDQVRDHVPDLPDYGEPVTVGQLVHHTSGIRDYLSLMSIAGRSMEDVYTIDDFVDLITAQQELNFDPGEEHLYSNSGYVLMTRIVEEVSGQSLRAFTDEHIFEPLGMDHTHFHDDRHEIIPNRAWSYGRDDDEFELTYIGNFQGVGDGGLYTTIEDMLQWDRNLYNNQLEAAPNLNDYMHRPGVLVDGDTLDYAFGLSMDTYKGSETVGHGGSYMGFRAHYLRFPEHRYSVALQCNLGSINPSGLARDVAGIYLEEIFTDYLAEYEGVYRSESLQVDYEISVKDGNLFVNRENSPSGEMAYSERDEYRLGGWQVEFQRDDEGRVEGLKVTTGRVRDQFFERVDE